MKGRYNMKKLLSLLLVFVLIFSLMPCAFADEFGDDGGGDDHGGFVGPVTAPPRIDWCSGSQTCYVNDSVYLSVDVDNSGGWDLNYTWYKNGAPVGYSSGIYADTSRGGDMNYFCHIDAYHDGAQVALDTATIIVTVLDVGPVLPPPSIVFQSRGQECARGEACQIYVDVENSGGYDLYYSWYKDGAWYSDGSSSIYADTSKVGTSYYTCEIGYYVNGVYCSITSSSIGVQVYDNTPVLNGIYMYSNPGKTVYNVGDYLSTNGLGIVLCYSDGSEKVVWSGFKCSPTYMDRVGTRWIDVEYGGYYTGFNVSVKDAVFVKSISVYQTPDKVNYNIGDKLDTAGLKLRVNYSDGGSSVINSGFKCSPDSFNKEGAQTVNVSYEGAVTSFSVSVQNPSKVTGISVASLPSKTVYYVGDTLDVSGMKVRVSTGSGFNTVSVLNNSKFSFEPTKLTQEGQQTIKVTYKDAEEYSCEFSVSVSKAKGESDVVPSPDAAPSPSPSSAQPESGSSSPIVILLIIACAAVVGLGAAVIILLRKSRKDV